VESKPDKRLKIIIATIVVFLLLGILYSIFILGINAMWFAAFIPFVGVGCIFYAFAGAFTKKKINKYLITILLVVLSFFIYWLINKPSKVVHMREDVIYVKPKAKQ
jgi:hypothetical protein